MVALAEPSLHAPSLLRDGALDAVRERLEIRGRELDPGDVLVRFVARHRAKSWLAFLVAWGRAPERLLSGPLYEPGDSVSPKVVEALGAAFSYDPYALVRTR